MSQNNLRPMTEEELREIAAQEAAQNAQHDLAARRVANEAAARDTNVYHDADHPAVTGTGTGDNRDETSDPEIAAATGGVAGMLVGAGTGSMMGPVGTVIGAVVGGLTGMGVSGLAVDAIDKADNDTTVSGWPDAPNTIDTTPPIV